ncbi:MAG: hypothetical protein IPI60_11840 [Saprospiraceae bacterium]|nr:hypothetical protein [Saprospiraceae bacterium]
MNSSSCTDNLQFDKWGKRIALISDLSETWGGKFKSKDAPAAVYVWHAKIDGKSYYGNVLLLR